MKQEPKKLSRRRFLTISAAAAGLPLLSALAGDSPSPTGGDGAVRVWRGVALGADAELRLHHSDSAAADRLIERCVLEVERLERVFSLYRADSALSRLNATGELVEPPLDLVRLLGEAGRFSILTGGAFDATVQPLWQLYAEHFGAANGDPAGPARAAIEEALARVGHEDIEVMPARIRFARPGMSVTLNGIAQGYITDRIVDLLRREGIDRSLVDMGETRAIGPHPSGRPWMIGLEDPRERGRVAETIALDNRAVSTSAGYGTVFDAAGRFNHIFDPRTGGTSHGWLAVSVIAPLATTADALSTAFAVTEMREVTGIVLRLGIEAHLVHRDGSRIVIGREP